jgi:hypothetical protein
MVGFGSVPGGTGAVDYAWLTLLRCLLLLLLLQHWGVLGVALALGCMVHDAGGVTWLACCWLSLFSPSGIGAL